MSLRLAVDDFGGPRPVMPDPAPDRFPRCVAIAEYSGVLARTVRAHKDADRVDARPVLAALLHPVILQAAACCREPPVIVPAPSVAAATRRRGRNPTSELATEAAGGSWPILPALHVLPGVADQSGLSAPARRRNVSSSIVVPEGLARQIAGRSVIVVDDVVTTGSTLAAAHDGLALAGAAEVHAAVICATSKRTPGRQLSIPPESGLTSCHGSPTPPGRPAT
ncbi:MAG: ComF family protein [Nostocoides sp.]